MWSLKAPWVLACLALIPVLIYLTHFSRNRGGKLPFNLSTWQDEDFPPRFNAARVTSILLWFLFWAGFGLLVFALSGPVIIEKEKIFLTRGIDMLIVLDESPSMSATDFKPENRFRSAKQVIKNFAKGRSNDQIGLVTFSSEAMLRVPPTLDYNSLLEVLDSLEMMELGDGTAIGKGIAVAALHLQSSQAKTRVIILITDGVNNEGSVTPETAAQLAANLGIRIYTIGIGKESDLEWIFVNPRTGEEYLATSSQFDEKILMQIAALSGGKYFFAGKPSTLSDIFEEIDSRETSEKRIKISVNRIPMQNPFILGGMLLICFSFICRKGLLGEII